MNGDCITEFLNHPRKSPQEVVEALKNDLLSRDIRRSKEAAALVRMSLDITARAKRTGTKIVTMIDNEVVHLDPESPLIPDVSSLIAIADELHPDTPRVPVWTPDFSVNHADS